MHTIITQIHIIINPNTQYYNFNYYNPLFGYFINHLWLLRIIILIFRKNHFDLLCEYRSQNSINTYLFHFLDPQTRTSTNQKTNKFNPKKTKMKALKTKMEKIKHKYIPLMELHMLKIENENAIGKEKNIKYIPLMRIAMVKIRKRNWSMKMESL